MSQRELNADGKRLLFRKSFIINVTRSNLYFLKDKAYTKYLIFWHSNMTAANVEKTHTLGQRKSRCKDTERCFELHQAIFCIDNLSKIF